MSNDPNQDGPMGHDEPIDAIVLEPQVRLGSLSLRPADVIRKASEIASELSKIIIRRKLFTLIQGKKHVWVEGWTTLGAILGVMPVEEWARPTADGFGFEARVQLFRSDGTVCGGASAQCTTEETKWQGRDSYAVRSMAITRATGKAFRLSFAWIMKLAGYEALPAEEADEGRNEAQVAQKQVADALVSEIREYMDAQKKTDNTKTVYCQWPISHNGHYAVLKGTKKVFQILLNRITPAEKLKWNDGKNGYLMPRSSKETVKETVELLGLVFHEVNPQKVQRDAS